MNIVDQSPAASGAGDPVPRVPPAREPFIVTCPACGGDRRVLRDDSQVPLSCRLCWERGVVAAIVANKYLRGEQSTRGGALGGAH